MQRKDQDFEKQQSSDREGSIKGSLAAPLLPSCRHARWPPHTLTHALTALTLLTDCAHFCLHLACYSARSLPRLSSSDGGRSHRAATARGAAVCG